MGAFRALLIGAGEFGKDAEFDSLPAVAGDVTRIEEALTHRCYECTRAEPRVVSNASYLDGEIRAFIKACRPDDTHIIYFSGHGIKYDGVDYLVPAGVSREEAKPGPQLVRTDHYVLADKSNIGHILILIDACRHSGDAGAKSDKTVIQGSSSSRLVRMFGCSPGEQCWTSKDNQSVFSAALSAMLTGQLETRLPGILQGTRDWCRKLAKDDDRIQVPRLDPELLGDDIASHDFFPVERKKASIDIGDDEKLWVMVLKSDKSGNHFTNTVLTSLDKNEAGIRDQAQNKELDLDLRVIDIDAALQSPQIWLEVVESLCKAPVVVVDAMEFQPGIMLLLGIRAVVKRGVTLTATTVPVQKWKDYADQQLPFNIQELKLIGIDEHDIKHPQHPNNLIGKALGDGLRQLQVIPTYQDLPGFDAVRCSEPLLHARSVQNTVLVLCPFGNVASWNYMSPFIETMSAQLIRGTRVPEVVRMLDMESARLVGPSLYEHIRWSQACIVDLTDWRPNVLFELGVRFACSKFAPVIVIEQRQAEAAREEDALPQLRLLLDLFRPIPFDMTDEEGEELSKAVDRNRRILDGEYKPDAGEIPPNTTYDHITEWYVWRQERSVLSPVEDLRLLVENQMGKDPQASGYEPALFSGNKEYVKELRRCAEERWIAIWAYVRARHSDDELDRNSDLLREVIRLSEQVRQWLPKRKYRDVRASIDEFRRQFPNKGFTDEEEQEA